MCDQVTKNKVETVVANLVSKGFMFTAWDITKFLRKNGDRISHRDVQDAVREIYQSGSMTDYVRDTKDVGAPVAPFVYYHQHSDVINYQNDWVENNPDQDGMKNDEDDTATTAATPAPANIAVVGVIGGTTTSPFVHNSSVRSTGVTSITREVTKEERLNIPVKMLQDAGFPTDSYVTATVDNSSIVIENKNPSFGVATNAYDVGTCLDGRVRLSRSILDSISAGDKFQIERKGTKIVVTPA